MKTALECAIERADSLEVIPPITDPMGKNWEQPNRKDILVDEKYAVMTRETFFKLHEYSASQPSGVYPGKMWRRHNGEFDYEFIRNGGKPKWLLCWFVPSEKGPDLCTTNMREILLSDGKWFEEEA